MEGELTTLEAAKLTGRSDRTIRRWIASGKLPARQIDTNRYVILLADLNKFTGAARQTKTALLQARIDALEKRVSDLERQFAGLSHQHISILEKYVSLKAQHPSEP
jgi:excisionase family DNA binding protein